MKKHLLLSLLIFGFVLLGSVAFVKKELTAPTASSLQNITISNHPTKGLQRRVDLISFTWDASQNYVAQKFAVYELDLNGNRDPYSRYEVILYASDAWLVNPATGALVGEASTTDPTGLVGEYTFFLLYAQTPIQLYPLLLSKTQEADLVRHRFDR